MAEIAEAQGLPKPSNTYELRPQDTSMDLMICAALRHYHSRALHSAVPDKCDGPYFS